MSHYVIDASVAVKWFVPETYSDVASTLLDSNHHLIAPDLLFVELGSVIWNRTRSGKMNAQEALQVLDSLHTMSLTITPSSNLANQDLNIALHTDQTMYDCTYVALAIREKATLVTADAKLHRALAAKGLAHHTILLSDMNNEKVGGK